MEKLKQKIEQLEEKLKEVKQQLYNKDKETYGVGDRFILERKEFILASPLQYQVVLISLKNGLRWSDPVSVDNIYDITQEKIEEITCGSVFTKVSHTDLRQMK